MSVTTGRLLEMLQANRLLSPRQLDEARTTTRHTDDPRPLVERLVEDGWLTAWQAQYLLAGGRQLRLGHFTLLELLGRGGMATVFKVRHPSRKTPVAMKVLSPKFRDRPEAVTLFLREGTIATALDHPAIVPTYGVESVDGTYALVMACLDGHTLRAYIAAGQTLPAPWACECIRQAALAGQYLASQNIVHRDLKPGNLFIEPDAPSGRPRVRILDLGAARLLDEPEDGGRLQRDCHLGTPGYMAPEQIENCGHVDGRADIFSLGCTLYELLTGRNPFAGETAQERLASQRTHDVPPIRAARPDLPATLEQVVARMTARNPEDRFPTPHDAATALVPFCLGAAPADAEAQTAGILLLDDADDDSWLGATRPVRGTNE